MPTVGFHYKRDLIVLNAFNGITIIKCSEHSQTLNPCTSGVFPPLSTIPHRLLSRINLQHWQMFLIHPCNLVRGTWRSPSASSVMQGCHEGFSPRPMSRIFILITVPHLPLIAQLHSLISDIHSFAYLNSGCLGELQLCLFESKGGGEEGMGHLIFPSRLGMDCFNLVCQVAICPIVINRSH